MRTGAPNKLLMSLLNKQMVSSHRECLGKVSITYEALVRHLEVECPRTKLECSYCQEQVPRFSMREHLQAACKVLTAKCDVCEIVYNISSHHDCVDSLKARLNQVMT